MRSRDFRKLLVLNWLSLAVFVPVYLWSRARLPSELRAYLDTARNARPTGLAQALLLLSVAGLLIWLVTSVGLFFFQRWAKMVLPIVYAIEFTLIATGGVHIEAAGVRCVAYLNHLVGGMILVAAYSWPHLFVDPREVEQVVEPERG
jgi:hypothetical protein